MLLARVLRELGNIGDGKHNIWSCIDGEPEKRSKQLTERLRLHKLDILGRLGTIRRRDNIVAGEMGNILDVK